MTEYPEHEKLDSVKHRSQAIGEFLEWLRSERVPHVTLCRDMEPVDEDDEAEGFYPLHTSTENLLAEFFGIDLDKIEKEKRSMLETLRGGHP